MPRNMPQPTINSAPNQSHKFMDKKPTDIAIPDTFTHDDLLNLIGRRLIIANFQDWRITVADPIRGNVEPAIGDYLKYFRAYLFFYSDGSPKARRSRNSAFRFCSRLLHILRRLFTRTLKPSQLWPLSSTDQTTTPRSSDFTETSCVPPQSGQTTAANCAAQSSNAD